MSKNPVRTVLISNDPKRSSRIQKALVGADPSAITVTPARAFSDAVDMIRSSSVDAFLLDFTLGGLRGLDLLNRAASAIPVVVIVDGARSTAAATMPPSPVAGRPHLTGLQPERQAGCVGSPLAFESLAPG